MLAWIKAHKEFISIVVPIIGVIVAILIFLVPRIPVWYEDDDQDGFGNPEVSQVSVWQPSGFVRNNMDCYDRNSEASPNAESYFDVHRGDHSFDYDCNGTSQKEQIGTGSCSNGTANEGWNGPVPACGNKGAWLVDCDRRVRVLEAKVETVRETKGRTQKCR